MPDSLTPRPPVSVVVPTYHEAENLPQLIDRLDRVRREHNLTLELLIMDDNSRDGTEELVAARNEPWVRLVVRTANRGLSPSVVDGLMLAQNDFVLVMDADLSHPPEKIPEMLDALSGGADFVIGSRYAPGGSTDAEWGVFRWLNSKVATLLARPLTSVKDPMSGFFALRRERYQDAWLNAVGYKIGLELLVKCHCEKVAEVPIHFTDRKLGQSKLSLREQLRYLQHLRRLFMFKYGDVAHLSQFLIVGASGTILNLVIFTLLLWMGAGEHASVAIAIIVSMGSNFALNRRFSFSYARRGSVWKQFLGFVGSSSANGLTPTFPPLDKRPLVSSRAFWRLP
ncbi:MAG: glycosyltransferase family 2 protein [Candidatus Hydrogenedentes bacterium]|nr:glycosyltransferase family 2 protein [Candidatus Hydrogenedentota bacterium]